MADRKYIRSSRGEESNSHLVDTNNPHDTSVSNLTDTEITTPATNEILVWNGADWVNVDIGLSEFTFSISSFTATGYSTTTRLADASGTTWLASGSVTYSGAYNNGPATSGTVTSNQAGFTTVTLAGTTGPTVDNVNDLTVPTLGASGATRTVTLNATDGTTPVTSTKTTSFHNYIKLLASAKDGGVGNEIVQADYDAADVEETTSDATQTWDAVTMSNEYLWLLIPKRCTQPTSFYDSTGFEFDMTSAVDLGSLDNDAGTPLSEEYWGYRSTNLLTATKTLRTA